MKKPSSQTTPTSETCSGTDTAPLAWECDASWLYGEWEWGMKSNRMGMGHLSYNRDGGGPSSEYHPDGSTHRTSDQSDPEASSQEHRPPWKF